MQRRVYLPTRNLGFVTSFSLFVFAFAALTCLLLFSLGIISGRKGITAVKNTGIEDALKKELPLDKFCYGPDPGTEANCWGFAACVEAMAAAICEKSAPSV